jgi:uncharacterized membrane protein YqiK
LDAARQQADAELAAAAAFEQAAQARLAAERQSETTKAATQQLDQVLAELPHLVAQALAAKAALSEAEVEQLRANLEIELEHRVVAADAAAQAVHAAARRLQAAAQVLGRPAPAVVRTATRCPSSRPSRRA